MEWSNERLVMAEGFGEKGSCVVVLGEAVYNEMTNAVVLRVSTFVAIWRAKVHHEHSRRH